MPRRLAVSTLVVLTALARPATAHFLEIVPSADVLPDGGAVTLDLAFTHPMERGPVMEMARPQRVGIHRQGTTSDLAAALAERKIDGKTAWTLSAKLAEPGAAIFFVVPQPYWEAAEKKWIVHHAKVVVDAYASGDGWSKLVGLPVEIEPLTRPTGLWTGNLFRGIVRHDGRPVPFAEVEVEWRNDGSLTVPNEAFVTQVIRADGNGVFAQTLPRAGWWGFAALLDGPDAKGPNGETARTELGGLIWVKATDMGPAPTAPAK